MSRFNIICSLAVNDCCPIVPVTKEEKDTIIAHGETEDKFFETNAGLFTKGVRRPFGDMVKTHCVFKTDLGCTIYSVRPKVCREHECGKCLR